jgi:MauM/NapG family ferredoxin protein
MPRLHLRLRTIRIIAQILFFSLFTVAFFALARNPEALSGRSQIFLRLNPLVGFAATLASGRVLAPILFMAVAVAAATALFGRFFCGAVCPLGALIDFSDSYLFGAMRKASRRPPLYLRKLKYVLLLAIGVLALGGAVMPLFMDPISVLTRIFTLVVYPLASLIGVHIVRPAGAALGVGGLRYATIVVPLFYGIAGAVLLMAVTLVGGFWDRRFWCQYICPSGAFFGLLSRAPLFRRTVDQQRCNACARCARVCPTRAIDARDVGRTQSAECIECGLCSADPRLCTRFAVTAPSLADSRGPDLQRRHIIGGALAGLALIPAYSAAAAAKRDSTGRMIRPPGAVPEQAFGAQCIACGQCMKTCPTNALQPCGLGDGFHRLYTPKVVPRIGGCEEKCHACGHACPTGAIRGLTYEEKRFAKIGTAVVNRRRCLAWEQNKECLVCDEVCPYNAIVPMVVETTTGPFKVPVVDEDLCIGCGMCEQHCPITDKAAIVVYRFGENRRFRGSYVSAANKEAILRRRRASDSHIGAFTKYGKRSEDERGADRGAMPEGFDAAPGGEGAAALPPGFVE